MNHELTSLLTVPVRVGGVYSVGVAREDSRHQ